MPYKASAVHPCFYIIGLKQAEGGRGRTSGDCKPVTIAIPQGSVLGPVVFAKYINELDRKVQGMVYKFVDGTKIGDIVDSEGYQNLQWNLGQLVK